MKPRASLLELKNAVQALHDGLALVLYSGVIQKSDPENRKELNRTHSAVNSLLNSYGLALPEPYVISLNYSTSTEYTIDGIYRVSLKLREDSVALSRNWDDMAAPAFIAEAIYILVAKLRHLVVRMGEIANE